MLLKVIGSTALIDIIVSSCLIAGLFILIHKELLYIKDIDNLLKDKFNIAVFF